jgi:hypothetical protein
MFRSLILGGILCVFGLCGNADAQVNPERLADAIYKAEGGAKTAHPYGIMVRYKVTTPRQACINTVKHALRDYKGPEDGFIAFLGSRYAPIGASNDPANLNIHWVKNVTAIYKTLTLDPAKK